MIIWYSFFNNKGSHRLKLGLGHSSTVILRLGGGDQWAQIFYFLVKWAKLRQLYKIMTNRRGQKSPSHTPFTLSRAICALWVTCGGAWVLAGWMCSALPVSYLDVHQRKTEPHLRVLTVPSGGLQGHLQVAFAGNLCLHSCNCPPQLVELGLSLDAHYKA